MTLESPEEQQVPVEEFEQQDVDNGVSDDDSQKPIYNKRQVSDVVKREQQRAYDRGKKEALMELQQQQQAPQQQAQQQQTMAASEPVQQNQQPTSMGGMPQMSEEDIRRIIQEQTPQAMHDHVSKIQNQQTVESFVGKIQAAAERYPDLEEKLNDLDFTPEVAHLVKMANNMDNTADIMKELMDNPEKMVTMSIMMKEQPKLAERKMRDLAGSIKQNQEALSQSGSTREPYSQTKPSMNAGIDNNKMTVSDFRKMFKG